MILNKKKQRFLFGGENMSKETKKFRLEEDSIGVKEVPADAYYGVQTLRAAARWLTSRKPLPS